MIPLYIIMLPILGVSVYFAYQQYQQTKQAQQSLQDKIVALQEKEVVLKEKDALLQEKETALLDRDAVLQEKETALQNQDAILQEKDNAIEALQAGLQNQKTLFRTMTRTAFEMLFVLDTDQTIVACSDVGQRLAKDGQQIVGRKFHDIIDAPDLNSIIEYAIQEEDGLEEQFILDGQYYRAIAKRHQCEDSQIYIGVALQDITQLVRLNRARRDMVANISHELGTPVANIRVIIDSLFHDQSRPKRKASIASLRAIARETESLQGTVQELLDLSMIESGQAIMKLVDEPLPEIVDAAIERVRENLHDKKLNIVRHVPVRISALCDRDHIRRVLVNLLNNAIKWSPKNDAITVSATSQDGEITISVFDNGPGVPENQRERIFERFYQVDTARSGREGSGLGLAISKHIVEAHGGKIWAEGNTDGGGGRFRFTLLSSNADVADVEAYMDRGQHDVIFNSAGIVQQNGNGVTPYDEDEGEIEFVEDDELDD